MAVIRNNKKFFSNDRFGLILSSLLFFTKLGYVYAISKSLQMVCMK